MFIKYLLISAKLTVAALIISYVAQAIDLFLRPNSSLGSARERAPRYWTIFSKGELFGWIFRSMAIPGSAIILIHLEDYGIVVPYLIRIAAWGSIISITFFVESVIDD